MALCWLLLSPWYFADAATTPNGGSRFSVIPSDYDALLPPPNMANPDPLKVQFGISIKSMDLNIMEANLDIEYWFRMAWLDTRLYYDGKDHLGANFNAAHNYVPVNIMAGDSANVWIPDVMCFNATDASVQPFTPMYAFVYCQEHVTPERPFNVLLVRPGRMKAYCKPSLLKFPYDSQTCKLHFGSWAFSENFIEMSMLEGGFEKIIESPDSNAYNWTDINGAVNLVEFEVTGGEKWSEVILTLHLERLARYFALNAVLPMFMMVVLSNLAFWIPINPNYSGSGERMSFSITCLLTIVAIALFTADKRPMIGVTTWLDRWIASCLLFTSLPILETIFVFFLDAIFQRMTERAGSARTTSGRQNSYQKYAELAQVATDIEAHQSKKVMKAVMLVGEWCWCCLITPRSVDTACRHILPVLSVGRLFWLLHEVSDNWGRWTPEDSSAYYTLFYPYMTLTILLFVVGVVWLVLSNLRLCLFKKTLTAYSATDSETDSESDEGEMAGSGARNNPRYVVGQSVQYYSRSQQAWFDATVISADDAGVEIDLKPGIKLYGRAVADQLRYF